MQISKEDSRTLVCGRSNIMIKKVLSFLLSILLFASMTVVVSATEFEIQDGAVRGEPLTLQEQYEFIVKNGSAKQRAEAQMAFQQLSSGVQLYSTRSIGQWELGVTHCKQQTSTWCGPATMRQTLLYINGTAPTQSSLATTMGTDTTIRGTTDTQMFRTVNSLQNEHAYYIIDITSITGFQNSVYNSLSSYKPVIDIVNTAAVSDEVFSYGEKHFLNISGIKSGGGQMFIVDPAVEHTAGSLEELANSRAKRWVSTDDMYTVTTAHECSAIIG